MKTTVLQGSNKTIIPLKTVKAFLRITHVHEDALLEELTNNACSLVEQQTRRYLSPVTVMSAMPFEPNHKRTPGLQRVWVCMDRYALFLPHGPVTKIQKVERIMDDGTLQEIRPHGFHVNEHQDPPLIVVETRHGFGVAVTYEAGYTRVPHALKQAVLQIVGRLYAERGLTDKNLLTGVADLMAPHIIGQGVL